MSSASGGCDEQPHRSFRSDRHAIVSRLAVYQEPALSRERMLVDGLRTFAAEFFVDREKQSDIVNALRSQTLRGEDLRGNDSFRVARTAAMNVFIVFTRTDERRHRVHVCRKN